MQFVRNLLGLKKTESAAPPSPPEDTLPRSRLLAGWATDVGMVRSHNEDTALIIMATHAGDDAMQSFGLFILADGMGGHQAGEVASSLAARTVAHHVTRSFYLPILTSQERDTGQPALQEVLVDAVRSANSLVAERVPGGGTTLTCALMLGSRAYIAHVGDSRAYIVTEDATADSRRGRRAPTEERAISCRRPRGCTGGRHFRANALGRRTVAAL